MWGHHVYRCRLISQNRSAGSPKHSYWPNLKNDQINL
jgi:hypothetical protein